MRQLDGVSHDIFGGRVYKHRNPGSQEEKKWVARYHEGNSKVSVRKF